MGGKWVLREFLASRPCVLRVFPGVQPRLPLVPRRTLVAHDRGGQLPSGDHSGVGYPCTKRAPDSDTKSGLFPNLSDEGVFQAVADLDTASGQVPYSRKEHEVTSTVEQQHATSTEDDALDPEFGLLVARHRLRVRQGPQPENNLTRLGRGSSPSLRSRTQSESRSDTGGCKSDCKHVDSSRPTGREALRHFTGLLIPKNAVVNPSFV